MVTLGLKFIGKNDYRATNRELKPYLQTVAWVACLLGKVAMVLYFFNRLGIAVAIHDVDEH